MIAAAALLAAQALAPARVEDFGWLAGRWETANDGRWTEESWSTPRAGVMLGHSRSGRGGGMREFEFLRIQAGPDGVPVYYAQPAGGPAVAFRLVARTSGSATFANPAHDFPQRIVYRREGPRLTATISAADGSRAISWSYGRR